MLLEQPCLEHGGRLRQAAHDYRIPLSRWLDLSTGLAPEGWPVPPLPEEVWRRLPEDTDGLAMACMAYFRSAAVLPVSGSQAAIQALPRLFSPRRVGVLSPCYGEHLRAWKMGGHTVYEVSPEDWHHAHHNYDIVVLSNPNNPTGTTLPPDLLHNWCQQLHARNGFLVVDEAFMDATPEEGILSGADIPGLIVLRSLGKFYGLAGVRCGFVAAEPALLQRLSGILGPWAVSHPARWIAQRALADHSWQETQRARLLASAQRLTTLLEGVGLPTASGCAFFRWVNHPQPEALAARLAHSGILVRTFRTGLRFGLPGMETDWERLSETLREILP